MRLSLGQRARCCLGTVLALSLVLAGSATATAKAPHSASVHPLVGAYYYLWNPENFAGGTLRAHLVPPQLPAASLVDSQSPQTAARDITNARQAGINFFAVDWWPYDAGYSGEDYQQADDAMKDFLAAPNIDQIRFAMFYETWNLGFDPGSESTPVTFQMELHFDSDMSLVRQALLPQPFLSAHRRPSGRLPVPDPNPHRRCGGDDSRRAEGTRGAGLQPLLHRGRGLLARHTGEPQPGGSRPYHDTTGLPHRAVRRDHLVHPVLRRSRFSPRSDQGFHRISGHHRHRGRRATSPERSTAQRPTAACR